jgi:hypothetical protein
MAEALPLISALENRAGAGFAAGFKLPDYPISQMTHFVFLISAMSRDDGDLGDSSITQRISRKNHPRDSVPKSGAPSSFSEGKISTVKAWATRHPVNIG